MPRAEHVHAWWIASLTAVVFVYACAKDRDTSMPEVEARPDAATPMRADAGRSTRPDAGAPCVEPIPAGELQDRASGPSVYGRVVATDLGWYDPMGLTACGIEGVRICVFDSDTCTESDGAGQFVLSDLESGIDTEITLEKRGYFPALRLAQVQDGPINLATSRLLKESDRQALLESLDLRVDPGKGGLVAVPLEPGEAAGTVTFPEGVAISMLPGGLKPYYSRGVLEPGGLASDELDPSLSATAAGGWGLFATVEPGDYAVRFERDGELCRFAIPGFGLGADSDGHIRVRIRAGFNTVSIAALCQ